jgi:hypothetical protein
MIVSFYAVDDAVPLVARMGLALRALRQFSNYGGIGQLKALANCFVVSPSGVRTIRQWDKERRQFKMKIELDLPERTVAWLHSQSQATDMTVDEYAAEVLGQYLIAQTEGDEDKLANRPDWQAAVERSRSAWTAGRVHEHVEILRWHDSHLD